jgi:hypothetical protein
MSSFSRSERLVAQVLSYAPGIKNIIKRSYQFANYILKRKNYRFQAVAPVVAISTGNNETFFGYYDKSPENNTGDYIIYQQCSYSTSNKPSAKHSVQIMVKDLRNQSEEAIGESYAYNWQQGPKLQWLTNETFIYNFFDVKDQRYKARIYNAYTKKEERIIDSPVYDCFNDIALTVNFNRLAQLRPDYGYRNTTEKIDFTNNASDGIYKINLSENSVNLILSIKDVMDIQPLPSMKGAKHKINHIMISPDGRQFMFMHRWIIPGGKRVDRLLISDISGRNVKVLVDEGMVSHCCWFGNDAIIGFFRYHLHGNSFYKIDLVQNTINLLSNQLLSFGDGHPSVFNHKMVFDSYPDRSRMKHLFIYDLRTDEVQDIGQFLEPLKYFGETRCDLHPKLTPSGDGIYIDSVHEGKRQLYKLNFTL